MMRLAYAPYTLQFKEPAGTSRGVLTQKLTFLLKLYDTSNPDLFGIGEASIFEGLSKETMPGYEYKLIETMANIALGRQTDLTNFPSLQFGLEQAILDFSNGGKGIYMPGSFTQGSSAITINGLVWMGQIPTMLRRIEEKLEQGFKCIKLKIGALDFQEELKMVKSIRERFPAEQLQLRVDANGGFNMDNVIAALDTLSKYQIHSIEQPIAAGTPELMAFLCQISPVPIALDEELIGVNRKEDKAALLRAINPQYIVLKPSLCGGFSGSKEWIELANESNIGWWVTSALESNIGLSALAQWVATLNVTMPQGLGTGLLYTNNFTSPLQIKGEQLHFCGMDLEKRREEMSKINWIE